MEHRWRSWMVVGLLLGTSAAAIAEEITLTTYYPSPRGVYDQLRVRTLQDFDDPAYYVDPAGDPTGISAVLAGNVGIGTTTPTAKLHIVQTAAGQPALKIDDQSGDTTPFYISDTGNVGIGTTTPALKFDVNGEAIVGSTADQTPSLNIRGGTVEGGQVILNTLGDGASGERPDSWTLDNDATGYFRIFYGSVSFGTAVDAVRITPTGDVGIGTGTPTARLDIREGVNQILFQLVDSLQNTGLTLFDREPAVNAYNTYIDFRSGPDSRTAQGRIWYVNNPLYDPGLGLFARYTFGGGYTPDVHISTATGNVGIGTATPIGKLDVRAPGGQQLLVAGDTGSATLNDMLYLGGGGTHANIEIYGTNGLDGNGTPHSDAIYFDADFQFFRNHDQAAVGFTTPKMTIDDVGNVGIGTVAPAGMLHVFDSTGVSSATILARRDTGAAISNDFLLLRAGAANVEVFGPNGRDAVGTPLSNLIYYHSDGGHFFTDDQPSVTYWLSILPSGNVGIGTTAPAARLHVVGDIVATGTITPGFSDLRLKTHITPLAHALEGVGRLRGVSFEWNERAQALGYQAGKPEIGVVAQEVEAVFPELVKPLGSEQYKTVDYIKLTAVLIEAVKELKQRNEALERRNETLEERVSALEHRLGEASPR